MKKEKVDKAKELAVEVLAHCEFDKKGRLVLQKGSHKANEYLKYLKCIYFEQE